MEFEKKVEIASMLARDAAAVLSAANGHANSAHLHQLSKKLAELSMAIIKSLQKTDGADEQNQG